MLEQYVNNIHINEKIKKIKIKILDSNIENGFSEIEILEREKERKKENGIINGKKCSKIIILIDKIIIKKEIIIQKIYRKIFIR